MSNVEDIEKAIEGLTADELTRFRAWFDAFDAARFDARIERDARDGALDRLAQQALAAHQAGRTSGLRSILPARTSGQPIAACPSRSAS